MDDSIVDTLVSDLLLRERLKLAKDGRQIFRDRRMNVHGALDDGIRRLRIHHVEQNVNYFIASDSKNRGSKNLFGFCINANFDETLCLAFFDGPAHLAHWKFRSERARPGFPYFCIRHAASPQRRINE